MPFDRLHPQVPEAVPRTFPAERDAMLRGEVRERSESD